MPPFAWFSISLLSDSYTLVCLLCPSTDLKDDGMVTVHIDAEQMGVGTATCGPDVLSQYRVPVAPTTFTFTLDF